MLQPFIFDPTKGQTPESIARQREVAAALIGRQGTPRNVGEGIAAIGNALAYRKLMARADKSQAAGDASATDAFSGLFGPAADGGGASPASGGASAGTAAPFTGSQSDFVNMMMPFAMEASKATGLDPRLIIAQAAQETGWGQSAPGNNYFGIKSHGVPGGQTLSTNEWGPDGKYATSDSFRTYGGPQQSVQDYVNFLQTNSRYKPLLGAQGMDAQLAALGASGYATDPNYATEVGNIARGIQVPQAPVQVASLDPKIGLPPMGQPATAAPAPPAGPITATATGASPAAPAAAAPPVQNAPFTASAIGTLPPKPAAPPPSPGVATVAQTANVQKIYGVLANPFATPAQKQVAQALLQQAMNQQDPEYQLKLKTEQAQLDALQHPKPEYGFVTLPDGTVLKTDKTGGTASPIYQGQPKPADPFTLDPGQSRYGPDGKLIANSPAAAPKPPDAFTLNEGDVRFDPSGKQIAANPKSAPVPERAATPEEKATLGVAPNAPLVFDGQHYKLLSPGGVNISNPPAPPTGYQNIYDEQGRFVRQDVVPGGPVDVKNKAEAAAATKQDAATQSNEALKAGTMLDATNSIKALLKEATPFDPGTGTASRPAGLLSNTTSGKIRSYVGALQSGVALETMLKLKQASSTGATGFGALSERELGILIDSIGALNPDTTDPEIFLKTIDRIEQSFTNVANDIKKNVSPDRIKELGLDKVFDLAPDAAKPAPSNVDIDALIKKYAP